MSGKAPAWLGFAREALYKEPDTDANKGLVQTLMQTLMQDGSRPTGATHRIRGKRESQVLTREGRPVLMLMPRSWRSGSTDAEVQSGDVLTSIDGISTRGMSK